MITKSLMGDQTNCRLVIRRNCSLTWGQTKLAVCIIAIPPLSIALGFASAGLWPVVPFVGLELLAVGLCFYHCAIRARECEVVTVDQQELIAERGGDGRKVAGRLAGIGPSSAWIEWPGGSGPVAC